MAHSTDAGSFKFLDLGKEHQLPLLTGTEKHDWHLRPVSTALGDTVTDSHFLLGDLAKALC